MVPTIIFGVVLCVFGTVYFLIKGPMERIAEKIMKPDGNTQKSKFLGFQKALGAVMAAIVIAVGLVLVVLGLAGGSLEPILKSN